MKRLTFIATLALAAMLFTSCGKKDYTQFIGTWGVEKIEYYNLDYYGNPIAGSMSTFEYDYADVNNSIQLVFKEDKTGEMRDAAIDTIWVDYNEETGLYETCIPCSDTVLVTKFTYSYDNTEQSLYMNMEDNPRPYRMMIMEITNNTFIYENEYGTDYVEKAHLRRISDTPTKSKSSGHNKVVRHPHKMPGTLFGDR